jgi:hypothetical protein
VLVKRGEGKRKPAFLVDAANTDLAVTLHVLAVTPAAIPLKISLPSLGRAKCFQDGAGLISVSRHG